MSIEELSAADPAFGELIARLGPPADGDVWEARSRDPFEALASAIVSQQLSTRAAETIWRRLNELLDGPPAPERVLETDRDELRRIGLSGRKADYLRDLAERVLGGSLDLEALAGRSDEEVIEELCEIRGIGRWTAEMFLMFHLRRPDVVSGGDLGIRKAVQALHGLDEVPTAERVVEIAEAWRPHRTLACLYLWRSIDEQGTGG